MPCGTDGFSLGVISWNPCSNQFIPCSNSFFATEGSQPITLTSTLRLPNTICCLPDDPILQHNEVTFLPSNGRREGLKSAWHDSLLELTPNYMRSQYFLSLVSRGLGQSQQNTGWSPKNWPQESSDVMWKASSSTESTCWFCFWSQPGHLESSEMLVPLSLRVLHRPAF
jgi:hypothetical protein